MRCSFSVSALLPGMLLAFGSTGFSEVHEPKIKAWISIRDDGVVRQKEDYSCGSAALATILSSFYGRPTNEAEVLRLINRKSAASFSDLQRAAKNLGYASVGMAANLDHLSQLKVPAILYLKIRGYDHFTVFRGIKNGQVALADPSWGNKRISVTRFLKMWKTIDKEGMYGRMLVVLPNEADTNVSAVFLESPESAENLIQGLTRQHSFGVMSR